MNTSLIAFFGSSDRLLRTVEDIARETGRSIKFYKYALDDAVDPAIRAVEEDCVDVIIAYRGTANLIKKSVNVPVLSVQNFELYKIDAISKLCKYSRNIIIPTTDCEEVNTEQLSRLFGANIHTIRYSNSKDLETSIREYKRRYSDGTVVSGGLACHFAHLYGLRHYLIVPAKRHIREVIDDAFSVAAANRENELWVRSCEAILNNVSDGVIAVDKDGFITLCNRQSYELLDLHEKIIGQQLRNVLPELGTILDASAPRNYSILQIGRTKFVIKFVPIELRTGTRGSLFTFNTARRVITGGKLVSRAVSQANRAKYSVEDYIHRSTVIDKMLMQLRLYASSNSTVLITGESGTGKEILAHALHNCSARRGRPFVSINCAAIPEQLLESELFGYEGGSFTGS
ncbi:MAG: sigma 54-interacting transcriptional regulator, partial [Desulfovibrionaceae bacterium]|nr:sigma 54-interacting transcriptional regulator [Desulfovibrionaceae bacterium]